MRGDHAAPSKRTLVVAFAAVAISFVTATVVSEYSDVEIRRAAAGITGNAAPSIVHLEAFRSEARRLIVLVDDYVDESVNASMADPKSVSHLQASRQKLGPSIMQMQEEWRVYQGLPVFPGERELGREVARAKQRLELDIDEVLAAVDSRRPLQVLDILERRAKPNAERLDEAVVRVVEVNAGSARRLAAKIDGLGRRSIAVAVVLDAVSVALTITTVFLLLRVLRRYTTLVERRAEELELFAGRVAHDILSPLGAASMALSYLKRSGVAEEPRAQRMLDRGQSSIENTRLIADDLLRFASAGARPDPDARADARMVVGTVVEEARAMAEERNVRLSVDVIAAISVRCSPGILASLTSNLVRNAIKYVGQGPGKQVLVRVRDLGGIARVEVDDNGPGLPPSMEKTVFEPYVRGTDHSQPGIGLGLATVKRMTEAHGGRVDVRSVPGVGCRFAFELPSTAASS